MSTQEPERLELLQGTLILRTLIFAPQHRQGIARAIQQTSVDQLLVEHGALYPALQRVESRGWIVGQWGERLNEQPQGALLQVDQLGRKQVVRETAKWERLAAAIGRVLGANTQVISDEEFSVFRCQSTVEGISNCPGIDC